MSHEDSLDEETKRILAEADSNDSQESILPKDKKKKANDEYNVYETNTQESPDEEW